MAALVCLDEKYYYPALLLKYEAGDKKWVVRIWRRCKLPPDCEFNPGEIIDVEESLMWDAVCDNQLQRALIQASNTVLTTFFDALRVIQQLGKWRLAWREPEIDQLRYVADPGLGYTEEIRTALHPFRADFLQLLLDDKQADKNQCPSVAWFKAQKKQFPDEDPFPAFHFAISDVDVCQINSWFNANVPLADNNPTLWVAKAPILHATTLLLAYRLFRRTGQPQALWTQKGLSDDFLEKAWELQSGEASAQEGAQLEYVDVDREAIRDLETWMFTKCGHCTDHGAEWGRNAGPHKDRWQPHLHFLPEGEEPPEFEVHSDFFVMVKTTNYSPLEGFII